MTGTALAYETLDVSDIGPTDITGLLELFDANYDQANHDYLLASFDVLKWISVARDDDRIVGFALGEGRVASLPRLEEPQPVALAGISCIDPEFRNQGLFVRLSFDSLTASGAVDPSQRMLFCGRMAHPVTYRTMRKSATNAVPDHGQDLTDWHREVITCVASLYQVEVDPETCVVIGKGEPIGYPKIEYEATAEEEALFAPVIRDRGDSLLAISWMPGEPPAGWLSS